MKQTLTNEEKIRLIRQGDYSIDAFISDNEKMIQSATYNFIKGKYVRESQVDDLLNDARYGFYRAVLSFDENRGIKFSTLAYRVMLIELRNTYYRQVATYNIDSNKHDQIEEQLCGSEEEDFSAILSRINTEGIKLTKRQRELYEAWITHQNMVQVAELFGVSKQTVHESIVKTQKKMRQKYHYLFETY